MRARESAERSRRPIYLFERHPAEIDRLDVQHYALRQELGTNYLAPIDRPGRVLDVGCGTGQWAYDLCAEFPHAHVVGVDIEPVKPGQPPNFELVRANVLKGLPFADRGFDLVHQRLMGASAIPLRAWSALVQELVRVARPGGWVEVIEVDPRLAPAGPTTCHLWDLGCQVVRAMGLDASGFMAETLGRYLQNAGLTDVRTRQVELPVGEWGGRIGSLMASNYRAMGTRLSGAFETHLGLPVAEHAELLRRAQLEWEEHHSRSCYYFACGRKREHPVRSRRPVA